MREQKKKTGNFISWAKKEFDLVKAEVYQFIHAWEIYGEEVHHGALPNLPWGVVRVITEPNMPMPIRQAVESGDIEADRDVIREAKWLWFEMEKAKERADQLEQHVVQLQDQYFQEINENERLRKQEELYKQVEETKAKEAQARELELRRKSYETEQLAEATRLREQELS